MPTFLDLARKVGSESGTVSGTFASVSDANPRVRKVVRWTNDAYRQIQNIHQGWGWLQNLLLEAPVTAGRAIYPAADLGATRFAVWDCMRDAREDRFHLTDVETGQAVRLTFMPWRDYLALLGTPVAQRPYAFTISPRGELVLHPRPDKAYPLRAPYRMAPQELVDDDDVPEMPAHFHDVIVDGALILLTTHDEAAPTLSLYQLRQTRAFSQLEREQLPPITLSGAFA